MNKRHNALNPIASVLWNLLLAMLTYQLCRIVFTIENLQLFPGLEFKRAAYLCRSAFKFDLSAILYTNLPYILIALLPLRARSRKGYALAQKLLYLIPNIFAITANLVDVAYFPFTGRRTTCTIFSEFKNESNFGGILLPEIISHWYLFVIGIAMFAALIYLYRDGKDGRKPHGAAYYPIHAIILLAVIYPIIGGLRGGFGVAVRPITLSNANQYIESPIEAGIVLNTPFSLIRTMDKTTFEVPDYFTDEAEMLQHFNSVHQPAEGARFKQKNVCIFVLESFSASYSSLLTEAHGKEYDGFTPFLDSLARESLCFRWSFANGRKSIEALPSILSGLPSLVEPYFLTPYSNNYISGIAGELVKYKGYNASFFHGAHKGSMGFEAFTNISGYSGQYNQETFGDNSQFDGTWAIWDEPFFQYFKKEMDGFKEPFVSTMFTASSHHPYSIPAEYEGKLKEGGIPMCRCVNYTDLSLRRFFEEARKSPWFENTIFILSADHINVTNRDEYLTNYGMFEIPILIYDPSGELKGFRDGIAQQADIMPTVLNYLGYDRPFVSFGCDLLNTPDEDTWAINYLNGWYQFYKGDWCLQYDGTDCIALYDFKHDRLQENNVIESRPEIVGEMLPELQSIIQQYMDRIVSNELTLDRQP